MKIIDVKVKLFLLVIMTTKFSNIMACENHEYGLEGEEINEVSLIRLIANPIYYDSQQIKTAGFIYFNGWEMYLFVREDDYSNNMYKNSLRIFFNSRVLNIKANERENINKKYVEVEGKFYPIKEGNYSESSGELHDISYLRLKSKLIKG